MRRMHGTSDRRRNTLQAMDIELDTTVMNAIYEALEQIVECANDGLITPEHTAELFKRIGAQLKTIMESRDARGADEADDEEDLEQAQESEEEEDALLEQVRAPAAALVCWLQSLVLRAVAVT
jgi:Importin repeat 6